MRKQVDRSAMIPLFEEIRDAFPWLSMRLDQEPRHVDLNMDIPQQPGLTFDVNLNLQGDELHLSAGAFWLEWFPCTRPDVVQTYRGAVHGLLSGAYRIREHYRGGRPFKAELQKPAGEGWQTIGTWHGWAWPFPRRTVEKIVQNVTTPSSGG
jgi:hypothetical protein